MKIQPFQDLSTISTCPTSLIQNASYHSLFLAPLTQDEKVIFTPISKTLPEVVGEKLLRPLIDTVISLGKACFKQIGTLYSEVPSFIPGVKAHPVSSSCKDKGLCIFEEILTSSEMSKADLQPSDWQEIAQVTLPPLPLFFIERLEALQSVVDAFKIDSKVAIIGPGGVGKSTLAMKYVYAYQEHYAFTFFAKVTRESELIEKLLELAKSLKINEENPEDTLKILKAKLHGMTDPYLFIIDGVDYEELFPLLKNYLPETQGCKILITTRKGFMTGAAGFHQIKLTSFTPEEAVSYLLKAVERPVSSQEEKNAGQITHKLGHFPLALTHAASYIKRQNISFKEYHHLLKQYHPAFFNQRHSELSEHEKLILITSRISMNSIELVLGGDLKGNLARSLMLAISCLKEELAPHPFLKTLGFSFQDSALQVLGSSLGRSLLYTHDELAVDRSLELLENYSLIDSYQEKPNKVLFYSVHPLVQQAVRYSLMSCDKPMVLAGIMNALGKESVIVKSNRILFDQLDIYNAALKKSRELYGEESSYTAENYQAIGKTLYYLEKLDEALKMCE
ncbi:MAG: NB-ARC domain-containing protein, partial [Candidatus Rhabdochlamydia sp.]